MIFARALGEALRSALEDDPRVVVLGEDIADPYGGAFKVTKGLTTDFPDRVRSTPISESAMTGVCAGLAMHGYRPILEIMFGDFVSLTFDQVANHIAKYPAMYDRKVTCPVIIRTPSGGGRGYGPTHSQSLEKHFLGIPHLRVVAASVHHDPVRVFQALLAQEDPVLYVEHKLLYPMHVGSVGDEGVLMVGEDRGDDALLPTVTVSAVPRDECTLTVAAYGYTAVLAARAIERLALDDEIFAELVVPADLAPVDWAPIVSSVEATGALLTVEEGTAGWSWGTELAAHIGRACFGQLRRAPEVLTSAADIIPSARKLEDRMLVDVSAIEQAIREAV
jgi:acetoin:2,6-dichlorophenolindophenol oxidoreductase subunit beta